jgi:hypothetical protein
VNRRSQLVNALERSNPTLETFLDLVDALDGEIQIVWADRKVEKLQGEWYDRIYLADGFKQCNPIPWSYWR